MPQLKKNMVKPRFHEIENFSHSNSNYIFNFKVYLLIILDTLNLLIIIYFTFYIFNIVFNFQKNNLLKYVKKILPKNMCVINYNLDTSRMIYHY